MIRSAIREIRYQVGPDCLTTARPGTLARRDSNRGSARPVGGGRARVSSRRAHRRGCDPGSLPAGPIPNGYSQSGSPFRRLGSLDGSVQDLPRRFGEDRVSDGLGIVSSPACQPEQPPGDHGGGGQDALKARRILQREPFHLATALEDGERALYRPSCPGDPDQLRPRRLGRATSHGTGDRPARRVSPGSAGPAARAASPVRRPSRRTQPPTRSTAAPSCWPLLAVIKRERGSGKGWRDTDRLRRSHSSCFEGRSRGVHEAEIDRRKSDLVGIARIQEIEAPGAERENRSSAGHHNQW